MESNSKKTFWDQKPNWCQPWSIITFGVILIISSWKFLNNIIVTSILGLFVVFWWVLFLILVPNSYERIYDEK